MRSALLAGTVLLAACSQDPPPASESADEQEPAPAYASDPLPSPDTEGAVWSGTGDRLVYGKPNGPVLMTLACDEGTVTVERLVPADPGAKAILAMIGNGRVVRLFVDSEREGNAHRWVGRFAADDPDLEVLIGTGSIEATIPGAGSTILNPSPLPAALLTECRSPARPASAE